MIPTRASDTVHSLLRPNMAGAALLTVDGEVLDYRGLRREVDRLSASLSGFGIGPNDRVAVVLPNGPEMALTLLAVMSVACAAPLNPRYRREEFAFYLGDLKPAAVVTLSAAKSEVLSVASDETLAIAVEGRGMKIDFTVSGHAQSRRTAGASSASGDDHALVLHTSGTTSRPKIVALRQRHLAISARNIASTLQLTPRDRSLNVMPLFHIHGIMAGMLAPLSAGASVVVTPGFDAFKFGRLIDELSPTYYSAVPTMHRLVVLRACPHRQPTTLRFVRSSSAALGMGLYDELRRVFGVPIIETYGMTEATHQMTSNRLPPGEARMGSVGLPAGAEVAIFGRSGRLLTSGHRGEVVIKGPTVIDGYENNEEANASAFVRGWFRTGDEGFLDRDGYVFLTGRIKEQINRGGEKISPPEVEEVLLRHGAVEETVVFAVPDERLGEEVGAVVVVAAGTRPSEAELRVYVSEHLAPFKVPRLILFRDEIPKGATGKVQRIGMAGRLGLSPGG